MFGQIILVVLGVMLICIDVALVYALAICIGEKIEDMLYKHFHKDDVT